jgi:hypothetical protein
MKITLTGTAIAAILTLTGMQAHASCADPRIAHNTAASFQLAQAFATAPSQENFPDGGRASERIVGTWLVTYTGGLAGEAFIQWHSDGTEWENIDFPILGGTICMGDWKALGERRVRRSHVGWLYTNGNPSGYFTETETDELSHGGASYKGTNDVKFFDLDGNLTGEVTGTADAKRIARP